jgi:hypothetical protein
MDKVLTAPRGHLKEDEIAEAIVLTNQPWPDGTKFELDGVRLEPLLEKGWIFAGATGDARAIIGEPVSAEVVELEDGVEGIKVRWAWLNKGLLAPGRYGAGVDGMIDQRGVNNQVLAATIYAVGVTSKVADPRCSIIIEAEEETDEG